MRRAICAASQICLSPAGLLEGLFSTESDLTLPVDFEDFDHNFITLFKHVRDPPDALRSKLGNVNQAIGARENLDEGAEIDDLAHSAFVYFSNLGLGCDALYHFNGFLRSSLIARGNRYGTIIFNVHFNTGGFDNPADDFAARTDYFANLIGFNSDGDDSRCMARNVGAR